MNSGIKEIGKLPFIFIALFLATFGSPSVLATEPEFKPMLKKVVRLRCHMEYCGWYRIETAKILGTSSKGVLYELNTKFWQSHHKNGNYERPAPRTDQEAATQFIFCSKQKPTLIERQGNGAGWTATPLQPGNSKVMAGATESAYAEYWAACHHAAVEDVYDEGDQLGKKLGYRFSGEDIDEDKTLAAPSDVLKW